jgi:prepilin-type N-terminal cleavage/methylation domain-containing protein
MSHPSRRFGFTLVELMVVSGIATLLSAQLFPAIQQAREAARRSQCKNNLKQLGLSLHNYHDVYSGLAPGWVGVDPATKGPDARGVNGFGWNARILPFIDQAPLYNKLDFSTRVDDAANVKLIATAIPMLRCPTDTFAKKVWKIKDEKDAPLIDLATTNYVGSFGTEDVAKCEKMKTGEVCEGNGVFYHNSLLKMSDITDGISNTIAVGERIGDEKTDHLSTWSGVIAKGKHPFARILGSSQAALNAKERHPSDYRSAHEKGVQFLMLDGAVRFIASTLDQKTFQAITTRGAGDEVSDF